MSEQDRKKQTFKLIVGAGLELSYSPDKGVKLRIVKPDFSHVLAGTDMTKDQIPAPAQPLVSDSKTLLKKGSILDIYC